jgi:hypothetical protein
MTTMFVRHTVTDFAKWKAVYDDFRPTQERMGVTADTVYRGADDPTDVTVAHEFPTLAAAQAFVASDELHSAMQNAGVAGAPTIWFASRA